MHTRRIEVSNRRFLVIAAGLLIIMISGSWFMGHAHAKGIVQTIDTGYYNAEEMKQPVPMQENQWNNGTYSNTKVNKNNVVFDIRDRLTIGSDLTITVQGGSWDWPAGNVNGNQISYANSRGMVIYEDQDTFLKETIILNAPIRSIEWKLNLSMKPQSLGFQYEPDGYSISDPTNEFERIKIPFPFVMDAEGTRRDLTYSWNNGQKLLSLNLDDSGLIYPLTIDPVYTVVTAGNTGQAPFLIINQTDYPHIFYIDYNYYITRLAVNNSGTWTSIKLHNTSAVPLTGGGLNLTTGLPFFTYGTNKPNLTWFTNKWNTVVQIENPSTAYSSNRYGFWPTGQIANGLSYSTFYNGTYGNFNLTITNDLSTDTPVFYPFYILSRGAGSTIGIDGTHNTSNILNILWWTQYGQANLTTATLTNPPSIYTIPASPVNYINITSSAYGFSGAVNPSTGFPAFAAKPEQYANGAGAGKTDGRAVNYSYLSPTNSHWYHEVAYKNETSPGNSDILWMTLRFNSSGIAHIFFVEGANGVASSDSNKYLNYIYRSAAHTWTTPVTIAGGVDAYEPTADFDSSDGIHVAWYNDVTDDLMYYFEPLPAAGAGSAPVASFQQDKLAILRNTSISLTDGSSNTPTSWDWYSPSAASCFSAANITNQNPFIFPKTSCKICLIATNAFGSDTSCEGSVWVARPWVVW